MRAQSLKSCPSLCNPTDCSPPGSSLHGILQARILEQVAVSYSRASLLPRDRTWVSCISSIAGGFFTTSTTIMLCYINSFIHFSLPPPQTINYVGIFSVAIYIFNLSDTVPLLYVVPSIVLCIGLNLNRYFFSLKKKRHILMYFCHRLYPVSLYFLQMYAFLCNKQGFIKIFQWCEIFNVISTLEMLLNINPRNSEVFSSLWDFIVPQFVSYDRFWIYTTNFGQYII